MYVVAMIWSRDGDWLFELKVVRNSVYSSTEQTVHSINGLYLLLNCRQETGKLFIQEKT